jgi:ectoine hydroxylase-related dioxygenase (phytanoyl-CoA dioxygenase family)
MQTPFSSWPESGSPTGWFGLSEIDALSEFYAENGCAVVEDCFSPDEVAAINSEAAAICKGERGEIGGSQPVPGESESEALSRHLCIHMPNKISEPMQAQSSDPRIAKVLTAVIGPNVKCMQSMLFIKSAGKPGQAWHQDESYIPTRDRSLTGAWLALDDATVENGCLWVILGSQQPGVIWPMKPPRDDRFDCAWESYRYPYDESQAIPLEMKAGSLAVFNGYLLHRSLPNRSKEKFRRALVTHYMSAESLLPWMRPKEGESVASSDFRDVWMVAGEDPYAFKGTVDVHKAHLRPDGKSGCEDWA